MKTSYYTLKVIQYFRDTYRESYTFFSGAYKEVIETDETSKELKLRYIKPYDFYTKNYCIWLDFRNVPDTVIHGNGREIDSETGGVQIQIKRKSGTGTGSVFAFIMMDASKILAKNNVEIKY